MKYRLFLKKGEGEIDTWDLSYIVVGEQESSDWYTVSGNKKLIMEIIKEFLTNPVK